MAKILHVVNDRGVVYSRHPFNAVTAINFDPRKHFMDHERSQFLELALKGTDYIEISAHAFGQKEMSQVADWLIRKAQHGAKTPDQRQWKFLYGHYTDKGSMIMIPADSKINSLEDIGLTIKDPSKAAKRMKRLKAPHQYAVFGKVLDTYVEPDGFITEFQLEDGYVGYVRHVRLNSLDAVQKAIADGQNRVKTDFLKHMGVKARNLSVYSGKGTGIDGIGQIKGYFHAQDNLEYDIVSYGTKEEITWDRFFFGFLGAVKPGVFCYSDLQSMTNFDEWEYAHDAAKLLFNTITETLGDEQKLKDLFMPRLGDLDRTSIEEEPKFEGWAFLNAIRVGMAFHAEPYMIRKARNHWDSEVVNSANGRIPMDHMMRRADICPDPHMFDSYGEITPENSIIPKGHMCCYDVPVGPTVEYRQPNGHALEHSASMNIHLHPLKKYEGYQRCFYGADMLEMNAPKNGADNDDTQVIVFDPVAVKNIRSLSYPLTTKMEVVEAKRMKPGAYFSKLVGQVQDAVEFVAYSAKDFVQSVEMARTMSLRLGQVVNNIMLDTLLSGKHKANMMKYLAEKIQSETEREVKLYYISRREWLADRADYQLRDVATNLEAIIDYCVQQKGDPKQFAHLIASVNNVKNETLVYPFIYGKQGTGFQGEGRIPPMRMANQDFIYAPSLMCDALSKVEDERATFVNDMKAFEYECITMVPEELEIQFGTSDSIHKIARQIRIDFNSRITSIMKLPSAEAKRENRALLHGRFDSITEQLTEDGLRQWMDEHDEDTQMFIAVELKRICHANITPKADEKTGMIRGVPDAVFGNDIIFNLYLKALEFAGLTGKYVPVEFDQISRKLKSKSFEVVVEQGNVLRKTDHFWIGTVDADNGEYQLVNGMLEVRKPHRDIADPRFFDEADMEGNFPKPESIG